MTMGRKMALELAPLAAFFIANWLGGVMWATAVFMAATLVSLAVSWYLTGKLAVVPLVSAVFVAIFGALTLWLHDKLFIQVKVTLLNALFGAILLTGLAFGRSYIKFIMDQAIHMPDAAWRTLTLRWGVYFLSIAALNEVLRRTLSWDHWVTFKAFGFLAITLVFALANAPFMAQHMHSDGAEKKE